MGKKKQVLEYLFRQFLKSGDPVFDGKALRAASRRFGFANYADAVKIDRQELLPDLMREKNYYLVHLGKKGNVTKHRFVPDIHSGFHVFEEVPTENEWPWKYRRSVLNERDDSESNILSVGFNQRIVHDFLYEDIVANPKMYLARRTHKKIQYTINQELIETESLQMEIDMTCELDGRVTVFEGKQGSPKDFAVYQLFHPYAYFEAEREAISQDASARQIVSTDCCYLLKDTDNRTGETLISMYLYRFLKPDPSSIQLVKNVRYRLIER